MTNHCMVSLMPFKFNYVFWLFAFCSLFYISANAQPETISKQRITELKDLLLQDCGSCHGMTMKGGLGPALTPQVLKNRSREVIRLTISNGRTGTPMPPWKKILTKQEINWIVNTLYEGIKHE